MAAVWLLVLWATTTFSAHAFPSLTELVAAREGAVRALATDAEAAWAARCASTACSACTTSACAPLPATLDPTCLPDAVLGTPACCPAWSGRQATLNSSVTFSQVESSITRTEVCTLHIDASYARGAAAFPTAKWQVFGTSHGVFQSYPGHVLTNAAGSACSAAAESDPRIAPWFVAAASGPKNLIIVLDVSTSMLENSKAALSLVAARAVLAGLTPADWVTIVKFSGSSAACSPGLLQATSANVALLIACLPVPGLEDYSGGTSYLSAFARAAEVFNASGVAAAASAPSTTAPTSSASASFSPCSRNVIVFLTDGDPSPNPYNLSQWATVSAELNPVAAHVFAYAIGAGATGQILAAIGCANRGFMQAVPDPTNIVTAMARYYVFLAAGLVEHTVRWAAPFAYAGGGVGGTNLITTASLAAYDHSAVPPALLGVAAIDFPLSDFDAAGCGANDSFALLLQRSGAGCGAWALSGCQMEAVRAQLGGPGAKCGLPGCAVTNSSGSSGSGSGGSDPCLVSAAAQPFCPTTDAFNSSLLGAPLTTALIHNASCCVDAVPLPCAPGYSATYVPVAPPPSSHLPSPSGSSSGAAATSPTASGSHTGSPRASGSPTSTSSRAASPSPTTTLSCVNVAPPSPSYGGGCVVLPSPTATPSSSGSSLAGWCAAVVNGEAAWTGAALVMNGGGGGGAMGGGGGGSSAWWPNPLPIASPWSLVLSFYRTPATAGALGVLVDEGLTVLVSGDSRGSAALGAVPTVPLPSDSSTSTCSGNSAPTPSSSGSSTVSSSAVATTVGGEVGGGSGRASGSATPTGTSRAATGSHTRSGSSTTSAASSSIDAGASSPPLPPISPSFGFKFTEVAGGGVGGGGVWTIDVVWGGQLVGSDTAPLLVYTSRRAAAAAVGTGPVADWVPSGPRVLWDTSPSLGSAPSSPLSATLEFDGVSTFVLHAVDPPTNASLRVRVVMLPGAMVPSVDAALPLKYQSAWVGFVAGPSNSSSSDDSSSSSGGVAALYAVESFYFTTAAAPSLLAGCPLAPFSPSVTPANVTLLLLLLAAAPLTAAPLSRGSIAGLVIGLFALAMLTIIALLLVRRRHGAPRSKLLASGGARSVVHTQQQQLAAQSWRRDGEGRSGSGATVRSVVGPRPPPASLFRRLSSRLSLGATTMAVNSPGGRLDVLPGINPMAAAAVTAGARKPRPQSPMKPLPIDTAVAAAVSPQMLEDGGERVYTPRTASSPSPPPTSAMNLLRALSGRLSLRLGGAGLGITPAATAAIAAHEGSASTAPSVDASSAHPPAASPTAPALPAGMSPWRGDLFAEEGAVDTSLLGAAMAPDAVVAGQDASWEGGMGGGAPLSPQRQYDHQKRLIPQPLPQEARWGGVGYSSRRAPSAGGATSRKTLVITPAAGAWGKRSSSCVISARCGVWGVVWGVCAYGHWQRGLCVVCRPLGAVRS